MPTPHKPWNSVRKVEPYPGFPHTPRAVGRASPEPRGLVSVSHHFLCCWRPRKELLPIHPCSTGWPLLTYPGMGLGTWRESWNQNRNPTLRPLLVPHSVPRASQLLLGGPGPPMASHSQ